VVFIVQITKGTMIGAVLSATLKTFLVSTSVSIRQLVMKLIVPAVDVSVIVVVRERGKNGNAQKENRSRDESFIQSHGTSLFTVSRLLLIRPWNRLT
jgi:hypothetical protein